MFKFETEFIFTNTTKPFLLALGGALSAIYAFTNTHGLIKSCLIEYLLLVYVLFNETDGFCNQTHRFYAGC